ncbi:MAG: sigma-54-dependent Fis family transcriptional regulator [Candidatus Omnitrophica bacterium]|nr:sigma-54-dependent Fis family transcriptional regulator [Candidatus Omnitrophota bacterium]
MSQTILIADDEVNAREGLRKALESEFRRVDTAADGDEAYQKLKKNDYDLLITDVRMPGLDGIALLKKAREEKLIDNVIILTAYGDIKMAVDAMKSGAYNYLTKPVDLDELDLIVDQVLSKQQLEMEIQYHRERESSMEGFLGIVGESPAIRDLIDQIKLVAPTKANVLITGETGTGKELVAHAIHHLSPRKDRLFVPIHCAALSENLLESELFGHERGAFTGAIKQRKGRFEQAHQGTIFLDEISEISQSIQVKLLRVLQEKEFERVGGSDTLHVDIRILAATNMNLQKLVEKDKFREDLYYRLKVVNLYIPPLRERMEDIPLLVRSFVERYGKENDKPSIKASEEMIDIFQKYSWPGNIRELLGVVESMVILARSDVLKKENIPGEIRRDVEGDAGLEMKTLPVGDVKLAEIERRVILESLDKFNGNRTKTAEALGIGRRTLIRKLHEYGVTKEADGDD